MTLDEAKKIAKIIATADGGCGWCAANLGALLNMEFPEFVFSVNGAPCKSDDVDLCHDPAAVSVKPAAAPEPAPF